MSEAARKSKRWLPLEANPDVMNEFSHRLGLPTSAFYSDVYGFDDELLAMVPQPVLAVLLLYPITDKAEEARKAEEERILKDGQKVSPKVYFMKQTVGNACGTIGLLHSILNNAAQLHLAEDSYFGRFLAKTTDLNALERAQFLEQDPELEVAHQSAASIGDTQAPDINASVDLHFVAFIHANGGLYELDGRKSFAVHHGPTSPNSLLKDTVKVIQGFIERAAGNINFNVIALTGSESEEH